MWLTHTQKQTNQHVYTDRHEQIHEYMYTHILSFSVFCTWDTKLFETGFGTLGPKINKSLTITGDICTNQNLIETNCRTI